MTESTTSLSAAVADRYKIISRLGEGGMATVYLAEDIKHDRKVALKVLKPELAAVLGAERFVQEIKTTAALQHPHILPLFDSGRAVERMSGQAGEFLYYVMPYIEGETLREKLNRETQLSIEEAVRIATEVADALHYAHQQGVIHRDIKPENILLANGRPMVADFGIALAVSAAAGGRMTETGLSLGTPHYMSPEQATADKDLNARSDIYSLGAVLYEMLTGEPPHMGTSAQQIIMKIVTDDPRPVTQLRKSVPLHISASVAKALERLPADRFHNADEFKRSLLDTNFTTERQTIAAGSARQSGTPRWVWPALALLAVASIAGWLRPHPEPERGALARFTIELPPSQQLGNQPGRRATISPDGRSIVYVGEGPEGRQLYVRPLRTQVSRLIAGTRNASQPFFSPDGNSVGFNSLGGLFKVSLTGGAPTRIYPEGSAGSDWNDDGMIVLSSQESSGLIEIRDDGTGEPTVLTTPDTARGEVNHIDPAWVPGRRAVVFQTNFLDFDGSHISALDLNSGEIKRIADGRSPVITPTGHLVYTGEDGVMRAAQFDAGRLEVVGEPFRVLAGVGLEDESAEYSVADNGTLVYVIGARADERALVIVDRDGGEREIARVPNRMFGPRFSPDGNRVAMHLSSAGGFDIWIQDVSTGDLRKLTLNQASFFPEWTGNGEWVAYSRRYQSSVAIFRKRADGSGEEELVFSDDAQMWETSWTPDGRRAIVRQNSPEDGNRDLWLWTVGPQPSGEPFAATPANERSPAVSPDGRYVAFASDESGSSQVYVRSLAGSGRWQVSTRGGTEPAWAPSGNELIFRQGDSLMTVPVQLNPVFTPGQPAFLLTGPYASYSTHTNFDVHPNGRQLAMLGVGARESRLVIIVNWFEALLDPTALMD